MTREEFGVDLLDARKACSSVQQLLAMINTGVHKGRNVSHLSEQYKVEKEKAKRLMQSEAISQDDAARMARDYPWLLT